MTRWLAASALFALIGCGTPDNTPNDAGTDAPADVDIDVGYPAPHPAVPQIQNQNGTVLTAPNVVPIFFPSDPQQSQFEDFLHQFAASSFWGATTSEYGVGPLTIASSIVVTDAPPKAIDTIGIEAWLAGYLDGSHAGWPAIDPNNVFAIFYPSSTTISDPNFGTSCTDFNGFHYQGVLKTNIVYAIVPRCPSAGLLTGFDALSASLSHEIIESATDPLLTTNPAWQFTDGEHLVWNFVPGAEVADMCDLEPQSFQRLVGPYVVQRSWSNVSALAGHDPCVPVLSETYFNAAPVFTTSADITFNGKVLSTKGLPLPLGQTKTIAVKLFSEAPTSDWNVQAIVASEPPGLTFSWDAQTGHNGDTLHLTITRTAATGGEFVLESQNGASTNLWFGFVSD